MNCCQLCRKEKKLIKAHVIPESFYVIGDQEPLRIIGNSENFYPRRTPVGVYDESILCNECDNKLGLLDQEAAEKLLRGRPRAQFQGQLLIYPDTNAGTVAKFVISVLWRAAVSNHYFFKRVSIGPYADVFRKQILEESSLPNTGVLLCEFDRPHPPFLMPLDDRIDGIRIWRLYASRFVFVVKTDRRQFVSPLSELELRENRPVQSIVLEWVNSPERKGIKELIYATDSNRKLLAHWRNRGHIA